MTLLPMPEKGTTGKGEGKQTGPSGDSAGSAANGGRWFKEKRMSPRDPLSPFFFMFSVCFRYLCIARHFGFFFPSKSLPLSGAVSIRSFDHSYYLGKLQGKVIGEAILEQLGSWCSLSFGTTSSCLAAPSTLPVHLLWYSLVNHWVSNRGKDSTSIVFWVSLLTLIHFAHCHQGS